MPESHISTWNNCLQIIKQQVSQQSFKTWFEPIIPLKYENDILTIQVPSVFFYEWIEEHYVDLLHTTIKTVLGEKAHLSYTIKEEEKKVTSSLFQSNATLNYKEKDTSFVMQCNPGYTFDNFIEGESNKLTKSVALSIAEKPGKTAFNPTFIHGYSGTGKSHILQAIAQYSSLNNKLSILYTSIQQFTQAFIQAAFTQAIPAFMNRYKNLDMLIIDDVQDLAEKYKTQEALFYIFNHLHQNGKQIIMASDCRPVDLAGLQKRLLSRFKWGLTTQLQMPEYEARIAIIQSKLAYHKIEIKHNLIEYIAASIETNVRDIDGVITSLVAHASLNNETIDYDLVTSILESIVCKVQPEITLDYLQETIAAHHKISVSDLKSKSRKREVVLARQVAMYLIKEHTSLSLKSIGKHFGGKDHSTVIYAQKSINNLLETDRYFKANFETLQKNIQRKTSLAYS